MTFQIYRKREVFNRFVIDEKPEIEFTDVTNVEQSNNWFRFHENGHPVEIKIDSLNYLYRII